MFYIPGFLVSRGSPDPNTYTDFSRSRNSRGTQKKGEETEMSIDQFTEFRTVANEFDEKIKEIEGALRDSEIELNSLKRQYSEAIATLAPDKDIKKIEDKTDETRRKIARTSDRLDHARRAKKQRLTELLPVVDQYRDELKAQKAKEFNEAEADLHKAKYQLLLALDRVGGIVREIDSLHAETNSFRGEAGQQNEYYWGFLNNAGELFNISPALNGEDPAIRRMYGIPEWVSKLAYRGRLPEWVREKGGKE